jgi:hypothetical protein
MTVLDFWGGHSYQVVWVHLTTAPDGDGGRLAAHHQRLRRMVSRRWGFAEIQWAEALTLEGHGVIHALWVWKGARSFYVPQKWLSEAWGRIHGAPVVWIERVRMHDAGALAKYMVTQYMAGQEALRQVRVSWRPMLGVSGVALWAWWKRHYRPHERREALETFRKLLREGRSTVRGVGEVTVTGVRAARRSAHGPNGWLREGVMSREAQRRGRRRVDAAEDDGAEGAGGGGEGSGAGD